VSLKTEIESCSSSVNLPIPYRGETKFNSWDGSASIYLLLGSRREKDRKHLQITFGDVLRYVEQEERATKRRVDKNPILGTSIKSLLE
jgi:hypothetical protein